MKLANTIKGISVCSFCGSVHVDVQSVNNIWYSVGYHVVCDTCKATGPLEDSEQDAIDAWNFKLEYKKGGTFFEELRGQLQKYQPYKDE